MDASEIDVRIGATWIDKDYIQQFMEETFETPFYMRRSIEVKYAPLTAEWQITGKSVPGRHDVNAYVTYGTDRANAYRILEDSLNLKDVRIYDTIEDPDGKQKRVLNKRKRRLPNRNSRQSRTLSKIGYGKIQKEGRNLLQSIMRCSTLPVLVSLMVSIFALVA